jgi:type IV pilus assembly protein PilC
MRKYTKKSITNGTKPWSPSAQSSPAKKLTSKVKKLKQADILWFADQMSATQSGGIPLYKALSMAADLKKGTPLGARLLELQKRIGDGSTLADAMRADEKAWTASVIALVQAGEASGTLGDAFKRVLTLVSNKLKLRKKLRGALTYPIVVIVVTATLVAGMLLFVVPRFQDIYDSLGSDLPSITKFVISMADKSLLVLVALIVTIIATTLGYRYAKTSKELSIKLDVFKFAIPVLGALMLKGVYARVSSLLAALLSSGIPLLEALDYASAASGSSLHAESLMRVKRNLSDGALFSKALDDENLWPDLLVQFVVVGEQSGSLAAMMEKVATREAEEVETASERLTSLIEPFMMVAIGAVIGVFLLALYLPILDLGSQIR